MRRFLLPLCGLLCFFRNTASAQSELSYQEPFSFWWQGKIGRANFEMKVNLDFAAQKDGCVPLSGIYYYPSLLKEMSVVGEYCTTAKTLQIRREEEGKVKESFSFSGFDGKRGIGIWSKESKEESVEIEPILCKDRLLLLEKIAAETLEEAELRWEKGTAKMACVVPTNYADSRLEAYARGAFLEVRTEADYSQYTCLYQIIPNETNLTLARIFHHYAYAPYWESDQDEKPDDRWLYALSVSVWQYENGAWKTLVKDETLIEDYANDPIKAYQSPLCSAATILLENGEGNRLVWDWTGKLFKKR